MPRSVLIKGLINIRNVLKKLVATSIVKYNCGDTLLDHGPLALRLDFIDKRPAASLQA